MNFLSPYSEWCIDLLHLLQLLFIRFSLHIFGDIKMELSCTLKKIETTNIHSSYRFVS